MKKILFTDLFNTLISPGHQTAKKYYNSREKEMDIVTNYVNDFLKDDNYIVVVTTPGAHDSFGHVFNNTLVAFHNRIDESLRHKIFYYMQGDDKTYPDDNITKKNINGKIYYFGKHNVCGIHVDKKEDAITDFLQTIQIPYQVYAIGDSARDIPMLLKTQELGGQSSFIDMSLYRQTITIDEIIKNELRVEFQFEMEEILSNKTIEEKIKGLSEQELSLIRRREERKQELYKLLYDGKLDLEKLNERYRNFIECTNYKILNNPFFSKGDKCYENYPFSDNVVKNIVNMPCYPSFPNYYTKVLKK